MKIPNTAMKVKTNVKVVEKMCSGLGQYHSTENKNNPQEYLTTSYAEICEMAQNPQALEKDQARWIIPSSHMSRTHKEQEQHGSYFCLCADLDEKIQSLTMLISCVADFTLNSNFLIYTTSSATAELKKCRIIIPLHEPITGVEYKRLQKILNNKLDGNDFVPDRSSQRCGQIFFLPNKGIHYEFHLEEEKALFKPCIWSDDIKAELELEQAIIEQREKAKHQARLRAKEIQSTGQKVNVIQLFNDNFRVEDMLTQCGYIQKGKRFLSPLSDSKTPGVKIKDNRFVSHHGSDSEIGIHGDGCISGDAFDLFKYFNHGNSQKAALSAAGNMFYVNGVSVEKQNQRDYMAGKEDNNSLEKRKTAINPNEIKKRVSEILNSQEPCGKFDTSSLPPVLRAYVKEVCKTTAAEPIMVLQSIICTASALIGRKIYIEDGNYFSNLYPNIWCCTISKSGSFKTTALNKGAAIAYKKQSDIQEEIQKKGIKLLEPELSDKKKKEIENEIALLNSQNPVFSSRSTAEAMMDELKTGQAGQVITSELGGWLANMKSSHAGNVKELLTDFYDVPPVHIYRTRTQGITKVERPFITINGVSTLDWIQKNLEENDVTSGFFARFLLFYPPQNNNFIPPALPQKTNSDVKPIIEEIETILRTMELVPDGFNLALSSEAVAFFEAYHTSLYQLIHNEQNQKAKQILDPYVKRWSPYLLKLGMIMQFFLDVDTTELSLEALQCAQPILDYAIKSTTYLFKNQLGETEHQKKCRIVLEYLAKKKGVCKWKQIITSKVLPGGNKDYSYICETLEDAGEIDIDKSEEKKRDHILSLRKKR